MGEFRQFLLLEQEEFLAQKVGDVLTALQSLADDSSNMGERDLIKIASKIVDQMRAILQDRWSADEKKYLKVVQKVATALAKACDTTNKEQDMKVADVVAGAKAELENLQGKLGAPINNLGDVEEPKGSNKEQQQPSA